MSAALDQMQLGGRARCRDDPGVGHRHVAVLRAVPYVKRDRQGGQVDVPPPGEEPEVASGCSCRRRRRVPQVVEKRPSDGPVVAKQVSLTGTGAIKIGNPAMPAVQVPIMPLYD